MCTTKTNTSFVKKLPLIPFQLLMKTILPGPADESCSKHASQKCFSGIHKAEPNQQLSLMFRAHHQPWDTARTLVGTATTLAPLTGQTKTCCITQGWYERTCICKKSWTRGIMTTDLLFLLHSSHKLMTTGINREMEACTPLWHESCHKLASDISYSAGTNTIAEIIYYQTCNK